MAAVLLVEDEPKMAASLRRVQTRRGHCVEWCANGASALERVACGGFDVMLLDYELGDIDGITVLRQHALHGLGQPVLLLSGVADDATRVLALSLGATDVLRKPVSSDVLDALIRRRLSPPSSRPPAVTQVIVTFEPQRDALRVGSTSVQLRGHALKLMHCFHAARGEPVTAADLALAVWGDARSDVCVPLSRLRRKLRPHAWRLQTLEGPRYRFVFD